MTGSLYLFPADPWPDPPALPLVTGLLVGQGLLGAPLPGGGFRAGDRLPRLLTFAGCSPHLELEPPPDGSGDFCHVRLHGPLPLPRLVTGPATGAPRCPGCRSRLGDWRPLVAGFNAGGRPAPWHCPECHGVYPLTALRWRHYAAWGRLLVEVHQVFAGEALPGAPMMRALEEGTGVTWSYGWGGGWP